VLEDQDDADIPRSQLWGVEEVEENVPYDLTGYSGGPIAMKSMKSTADAIDTEQAILQAGFAAEYDRLESQGKPGVLGGGMQSVIEAPFVHHPGPEHQTRHRRGPSNVDVSAREEAQKVAEKRGEILAVAGTWNTLTNRLRTIRYLNWGLQFLDHKFE
jgi:hypothetical protein